MSVRNSPWVGREDRGTSCLSYREPKGCVLGIARGGRKLEKLKMAKIFGQWQCSKGGKAAMSVSGLRLG